MAITPHDSTGTSLSFQGTNFTVTSIVYSANAGGADNLLDVSHLGITAGNSVLTMPRPLAGGTDAAGKEVTIEYQGKNIIAANSSGTLTITHAGATFVTTTSATATANTVTFAVNDIIKGTATFTLP